MHRYTLCLIFKEGHLLLLNRAKPPAMGMWNGVGGKIETGETPVEAVIRETCEETGISLEHAEPAGEVILKNGSREDGIYLFTAVMPRGTELHTPVNTREGMLDWKPLDWVLHPDNAGIISNLKNYLPAILQDKKKYIHILSYDGHKLIDHEKRSPRRHPDGEQQKQPPRRSC